ncbi:MAG: EDD domain protein [Candidatus Reconcilbacillus cellulovorans]|uniref:EDD domain protein n=1 Tax=Candidatus Reconcilbacillus cellulovorans TaxID=1906605 RepID=A0A2A6E3V6_9BACL|nr:MAG: EDD domain protein [Candidatus Reconcilbacillus cellulovorans]
MGCVRIVTDSAADLPREVRDRLNIAVVPLKVHFGGETYLDGETIDPQTFYARMVKDGSFPTTSQPSPADFAKAYANILDETPDASVVSIHLSSRLSGTIQSAQAAVELVDRPIDLSVVDSRSASLGVGVLAEAAAEAALAGKSKEDILELIDRKRREVRIYFTVDTLEFLHRGGRIGKAAALFGTLLNVKPILTIDDEGVVAPVDRVRGFRKATERVIERLEQDFGIRRVRVTLVDAAARERAEEWAEWFKTRLRAVELRFASIGPVIGAHVGPGTIGAIVEPV